MPWYLMKGLWLCWATGTLFLETHMALELFKCHFLISLCWLYPFKLAGSIWPITGRTNQSEILIDLVGLDIQSVSLPGQQPPTSSLSIPADLLCGSTVTDPQSHSPSVPSAALSLLDEELLSLGNMQCNSSSFICFSWKHLRTSCLHVHMWHVLCSFTGLNEPAPIPNKSTRVNLSNHLPSLQVFKWITIISTNIKYCLSNTSVFLFNYLVFQDSSQDFDFFETTSPSVSAFSTSSLHQDGLSVTVAPISSAKSSTTASGLSFPGPVFSTPPTSTRSVSTTSVIFPQPLSSVLTTTAPAALPQAFSMASPATSATPVTQQQVSTSPGASHTTLTSLSHNLQDLALLDLGSPKMWVRLAYIGKTGERIWISTYLSIFHA